MRSHRIHILFIGNALARHGSTPTSADIMPGLLRDEGFGVVVASSKRHVLFRMLDMLWRITRNSRWADIVLIATYSTKSFWYAWLCSRLCRLLKLEYVPILHGGDLPQRMDRSPRMTRAILQHSFHNVSPSRYLVEAVEQRGFSAKLIPNTIQVAEYAFIERKALRPRLLYVRAFAGLYNPQMGLHVLKALLVDFPEAKICMVGPDKDGTLGECRQLAETLGIEDHARFPGRLTKPEWHKLSEDYDIFINTTNKDNTPVSVIEAMALGLPVVSTNPGGVPFLIDDGQDGLLVECSDTDAMVSKIRFLLQHPEQAVAISRSARSKVEAFDWSVVLPQWDSLIRQVSR